MTMSPWQDPLPRPDPPRRWTEVFVYLTAAVIGAFMIANIVRGISGYGFNW